jgi:hypothetical protein
MGGGLASIPGRMPASIPPPLLELLDTLPLLELVAPPLLDPLPLPPPSAPTGPPLELVDPPPLLELLALAPPDPLPLPPAPLLLALLAPVALLEPLALPELPPPLASPLSMTPPPSSDPGPGNVPVSSGLQAASTIAAPATHRASSVHATSPIICGTWLAGHKFLHRRHAHSHAIHYGCALSVANIRMNARRVEFCARPVVGTLATAIARERRGDSMKAGPFT